MTATESRAIRARAEFVLADFEEWAGFDATGEGWQRLEAMTADDLAMIAVHNLDNGEALDALRDRYLYDDAALYAAHPDLCPECGGHGCVERRWVTGTWADWNGPAINVDDVACPTCGGAA